MPCFLLASALLIIILSKGTVSKTEAVGKVLITKQTFFFHFNVSSKQNQMIPFK